MSESKGGEGEGLGTTYFVTGASRGLGLEFVSQIAASAAKAKAKAHIFAACRDPQNAAKLLDLAKQADASVGVVIEPIKLEVTSDDDMKVYRLRNMKLLSSRGETRYGVTCVTHSLSLSVSLLCCVFPMDRAFFCVIDDFPKHSNSLLRFSSQWSRTSPRRWLISTFSSTTLASLTQTPTGATVCPRFFVPFFETYLFTITERSI